MRPSGSGVARTRRGYPGYYGQILVGSLRTSNARGMADADDVDLGELYPTEASARLNAIYGRMYEWQFGLEALRRLDEEDLIYIAGHRMYAFPKPSDMDDETALGIQQKMRGNGLRAKDELDRRQWLQQLEALHASNLAVAESNRHIDATARWTRWMAIATICVAAVAAVTLVVTVVVALRN